MFEECRVQGDFNLSSGRRSSVFYDFDLLSPREAANYVDRALRKFEGSINWQEIDFVVAPAVGGIVPGFLVSFAKDKPLVILDKQDAARGPEFKEGCYLIVDDVITSFQAANKARKSMSQISTNLKCMGVLAYVFRGALSDLEKQDVPAYYLSRKEQEHE